MIEDKLTHDERLRLECVAQAINHAAGRPADIKHTLDKAKDIEAFVKSGENAAS